MRTVKWIALGLGGLLLVAVAVAAYIAATFDPNDYKPHIVELVKQQTGRTLTIDGKIRLTFFPKIGARVGKATLSEPKGPAVFARVEEARVAVAVWPLLSKQVVVDSVRLKGLTVDLVRFKNGRTNFDDLTGETAAPAKPGKPGEAPGPKPAGPPLQQSAAIETRPATSPAAQASNAAPPSTASVGEGKAAAPMIRPTQEMPAAQGLE